MKHHYPLLQRIFGPKFTQDDLYVMKFRALDEGWSVWLDQILLMENKRNRNWLLCFIRDGLVFIEPVEEKEDVYEDTDPYELP